MTATQGSEEKIKLNLLVRLSIKVNGRMVLRISLKFKCPIILQQLIFLQTRMQTSKTLATALAHDCDKSKMLLLKVHIGL